MMTANTLDHELSREPFLPFRLHLSDGRTADVQNPGLSFIARLALYLARTDRPNSRISDDFHVISLRHIVSIEMVETAPQV